MPRKAFNWDPVFKKTFGKPVIAVLKEQTGTLNEVVALLNKKLPEPIPSYTVYNIAKANNIAFKKGKRGRQGGKSAKILKYEEQILALGNGKTMPETIKELCDGLTFQQASDTLGRLTKNVIPESFLRYLEPTLGGFLFKRLRVRGQAGQRQAGQPKVLAVADDGTKIEAMPSLGTLPVQFVCDCGTKWGEGVPMHDATYKEPKGLPHVGVKARACRGCGKFGTLTATFKHNEQLYRIACVKDKHGIPGDHYVNAAGEYMGSTADDLQPQVPVANLPDQEEKNTEPKKTLDKAK